jgi:cytochrome c peroxidase
MIMGDGQPAVYDNGFYNIGVRPTFEDLGVGGNDPFGNPLSETRVAQLGRFNALLGDEPNVAVAPGDWTAVDGAFKTPGLRNVELTAPCFHNGGQLTLRQVVDFYNRGGDRRGPNERQGNHCALARTTPCVLALFSLVTWLANSSATAHCRCRKRLGTPSRVTF